MSKEDKRYYLYIDGQAVPVSEQVYREYHHYARKEEYFTYDLKREKFACDQEAQTAHFTPSREDSYHQSFYLYQSCLLSPLSLVSGIRLTFSFALRLYISAGKSGLP